MNKLNAGFDQLKRVSYMYVSDSMIHKQFALVIVKCWPIEEEINKGDSADAEVYTSTTAKN